MNPGPMQQARRMSPRIAFLQDNGINESLALTELSAYLRAHGRQTALFLAREDRRFADTIAHFDPQMVIIPCDIMGHNWALQAARTLKKGLPASIPIVFGGVLPTFYPEIVRQPGVDMAFRGEAEGVVLELSERLSNGESVEDIRNLVIERGGRVRANPMRPLLDNLDALPLPDRELYYRYPFIKEFGWKKFSTSRGCVNNCGYCFNPTFKSMLGEVRARGFLRRKSVGRVIEEIRAVKEKYVLRIVHFSDDIFSTGTEWLEAFAGSYRTQIGVPFSCNVYAKFITPRTVRLLKEAGCVTLSMGVETADEKKRIELLNKSLTNEEVLSAAREIKKAGIFLITFNMLGLPGCDVEEDLKTLDLNRKIRSDHQRVAVTVPVPYSRMARECVSQGLLPPDFLERVLELPDLSQASRDTLYRLPDRRSVMNLYYLWYLLMRVRLPAALTKVLLRAPLQSLYRAFMLLALPKEKQAFRLRWTEGVRYFLHVGSPSNKTTNYVTLI